MPVMAKPSVPIQTPLGKRARRAAMGVATVTGLAKRGFFIPYRYAAGVRAPTRYDALAQLFDMATESIVETLKTAERLADRLEAFTGAVAPSPRWEQSWFPRLDGAAAYALMRDRPPETVIEVGSGHSTRFVAQALSDAGASARHVAIDPAPRAALRALAVDWRSELLSPQHADLFAALAPGDVAFFDSSHILAPGTDVDIILNRLLPALRPGVRVHIHDVFLPDPYPASWSWRGYNEQNALGPLLASGAWRILFASAYAAASLPIGSIAPRVAALPLPDGALESSLWLERR